jgi:hypothetical protein
VPPCPNCPTSASKEPRQPSTAGRSRQNSSILLLLRPT